MNKQRFDNAGVLLDQWSNATRADDPKPAGYTAFNPDGSVASTRALTNAEATELSALDALSTSGTNSNTLLGKIPAALAANLAFITAAKPGTAAAQASAAYDQSVRQARQWNALARVVAGLLDDTSGT